MGERGKYQTEMEWAIAHPGEPLADQLISLASMYRACPEPGALGLIDATCAEIRALLAPSPRPGGGGE